MFGNGILKGLYVTAKNLVGSYTCLTRHFCITIALILLSACTFTELPITQEDHAMQVWRKENGLRPVPDGWRKYRNNLSDTLVVHWENPDAPRRPDESNFRGYYLKIQHQPSALARKQFPSATAAETDCFHSGRQVMNPYSNVHGDSKRDFINEELELTYYIHDGIVVGWEMGHIKETRKFSTDKGDFEIARKLAEEWCAPPPRFGDN